MDLLGDVLNQRFRLDQEIGRGGFGVVYRATDLHLGREVAVKVLFSQLASDDSVQRFLREAQVSSQLQDPHIITTFDFGAVEGGVIYIVTELLKGLSLQGLHSEFTLSMTQICDLMAQASQGLLTAHQAGVIHRDIKPANLFVEWRNKVVLKVIDFGIAKALQTSQEGGEDPSQTKTKALFGTPHYMSPEQVRSTKNVSFGTDIYSLGVVLYELVFGKLPFDSEEQIQIMIKHLQEPLPPLGESPPEVHSWLSAEQWTRVKDLIRRMMDKSEETRWSDLGAIVEEFSDLAHELKKLDSSRYSTELQLLKNAIEGQATTYSKTNGGVSLPKLDTQSGVQLKNLTSQGSPQANQVSPAIDPSALGDTLDSSNDLIAPQLTPQVVPPEATVDWDESSHRVSAIQQIQGTPLAIGQAPHGQGLQKTLDTVMPKAHVGGEAALQKRSLSKETITPLPNKKTKEPTIQASLLQADFAPNKGFSSSLDQGFPTMFPEGFGDQAPSAPLPETSKSNQSVVIGGGLVALVLAAVGLFTLFSSDHSVSSSSEGGVNTTSVASPTKAESPKVVSPAEEPPKEEPTKTEPPKEEPTKAEAPKEEAPKEEPTKAEPPKPSSVKLYFKPRPSFSVGDQVNLSAKVLDTNGQTMKEAIKYVISPSKLATVKNGKLYIKKSGEGRIKACLSSQPKLCSPAQKLYVIDPF